MVGGGHFLLFSLKAQHMMMELAPPAVESGSFNHWISREVPVGTILSIV